MDIFDSIILIRHNHYCYCYCSLLLVESVHPINELI